MATSFAGGYFRMAEETADVLARRVVQDRRHRHGRRGRFITIVDRNKDIIITGGINVYSREVEEVLLRHPAVAQAAVIGIPTRSGARRSTPSSTPAGASALTPTTCRLRRDALASYKKPRTLEIDDELPIGGTGKILKRELDGRHTGAGTAARRT